MERVSNNFDKGTMNNNEFFYIKRLFNESINFNEDDRTIKGIYNQIIMQSEESKNENY